MLEKQPDIKIIKNKIDKIFKSMRNKTLCFTGHRAQNLPWGFDENDERCKKLKQLIKMEITNAIQKGYRYFLSGMASGFDMFCAEIVLELKNTFPKIKLECVLPCKNQTKYWNLDLRERHQKILNQADFVRCVYENYIAGCMKERNQYMVNSSSMIITFFNGNAGGTKQTLDYAKSKGLKIKTIYYD